MDEKDIAILSTYIFIRFYLVHINESYKRLKSASVYVWLIMLLMQTVSSYFDWNYEKINIIYKLFANYEMK